MVRYFVFVTAHVSTYLLLTFAVVFGAPLQQETPPKEAAEGPRSVATKDEKTFSDMMPTDDAIRLFQERVSRNPHDFGGLIVLGQLYQRQAAESGGSHESYQLAEQSFRDALKIKPDSAGANRLLAHALQSQHRFGEALEQTSRTLELLPDDLVALASRSDALLELGRFDEAVMVLEKVAAKIRTPGTLARLARVAELRGDVDQAVALLEEALAESIKFSERPETTAWYDFRLGMIEFNRGNREGASTHFQDGLRRNPDDVRAINGLAEVAAARGQFDEAEKWYRLSLELSAASSIMAEFGDLLLARGDDEGARKWFDRADATTASEADNAGVAHWRARALFLLDHERQPEQALELAQKDMRVREDIYTWDTLAWAQYRNGKFDEAARSADKALALGTRDAKLYWHAGLIAWKRGELDEARRLLREALAINPHFSLAGAEEARRILEELGDP